MPDFTVTDEIIAKIANQYNIPKESIELLQKFYESFTNDMKQQYLAHVIRTMEERLRKISDNDMFRIVCSPVDSASKELGIARAQYFKKRYFVIYYHPNTDEKQLRVMLAHELGHLFLIEMVNSTLDEKYDEKAKFEPLATIFGIFAIFDKNEFYHNKTTPFKHKSPDEILGDFALLHNRDKSIYNIS
jgi:Zn-dependent peptidase ImmA (M78 family)